MGSWFNGEYGAGLTTGLDDLWGLFQLWQFYDSMSPLHIIQATACDSRTKEGRRHAGRRRKQTKINISNYFSQTRGVQFFRLLISRTREGWWVGEKKRHIHVGNKAGHLFFTEKHVWEKRKRRHGCCTHLWLAMSRYCPLSEVLEDYCSRFSPVSCLDSEGGDYVSDLQITENYELAVFLFFPTGTEEVPSLCFSQSIPPSSFLFSLLLLSGSEFRQSAG